MQFYKLYSIFKYIDLYNTFCLTTCLKRNVRSHNNHFGSVMQQPLLANQMSALSAHPPINVGIAHVVWPQPANKRNRNCQNR